MRIFAVDTSAKTASCAVVDFDESGHENIVSYSFVKNNLTHSETLMPMIFSALKNADVSLESIDLFAVSSGPGSFTGVRIGVAVIKGLAQPLEKPCVGVSTLDAVSVQWFKTPINAVICVSMDARRNQVYAANFLCENGKISRLSGDDVISIERLGQMLEGYKLPIILAGDGASLCYNQFVTLDNSKQASVPLDNFTLAPEYIRIQNAVGVAISAFWCGERQSAEKLRPTYLRLSQAERELNEKNKNKQC